MWKRRCRAAPRRSRRRRSTAVNATYKNAKWQSAQDRGASRRLRRHARSPYSQAPMCLSTPNLSNLFYGVPYVSETSASSCISEFVLSRASSSLVGINDRLREVRDRRGDLLLDRDVWMVIIVTFHL